MSHSVIIAQATQHWLKGIDQQEPRMNREGVYWVESLPAETYGQKARRLWVSPEPLPKPDVVLGGLAGSEVAGSSG